MAKSASVFPGKNTFHEAESFSAAVRAKIMNVLCEVSSTPEDTSKIIEMKAAICGEVLKKDWKVAKIAVFHRVSFNSRLKIKN